MAVAVPHFFSNSDSFFKANFSSILIIEGAELTQIFSGAASMLDRPGLNSTPFFGTVLNISPATIDTNKWLSGRTR